MKIEKCEEQKKNEDIKFDWDYVVYPKVGEFKDHECRFLVLFFARKKGLVIKVEGTNARTLGIYDNDWGMDQFRPIDYPVTVTLTV